MRAVLQRVARATVRVDGGIVSEIGQGLLILLGVAASDGPQEADWMTGKLVGLRVFENTDGRLDRSVVEVGGGILLVSQFTLCADTRTGRRPSFTSSAAPKQAETLYNRVAAGIARHDVPVRCGRFGARMQVSLVNDGPVTIVIDTASADPPSA